MPYALPLEVIELVIDQLDSNQPADTAALSSCTLACKALLPHSSRQLFKRRVSLDTVRLRQFTTALSTSYRLKAYVASLKVDVRRTDGMSSSLSALRLLREIVGTLTAVTALLVIGDRAVDKAVLRWIDEAPIATYPLEHLSVVGAQVPLTDAILGFFPEVRTLTVSEWPNDRYPGANVSAHAVRNLVFEDPLYRANVASVLDIVRVLSPPSLSSLALQFHDIHKEQMTFAAVNGLLRTLGRHISNFEIVRYSENWGAGADPALPALSECTSLRSAVLHTSVEMLGGAAPDPRWQDAVDVLCSLPPHVAHVTLVTQVWTLLDFEGLVHALDWPRLERALQHCAALTRVDAVLRLDATAAEWLADLRGEERWRGDVLEGIMTRLGPQFRSLVVLRFEDL